MSDNALTWWSSAKQWARETWAELTAPAPINQAEYEAETRRSIRTLLETAEELATLANLHDVNRVVRLCRVAVERGREKVAADAISTSLVGYSPPTPLHFPAKTEERTS
jgi:hypothetical protein